MFSKTGHNGHDVRGTTSHKTEVLRGMHLVLVVDGVDAVVNSYRGLSSAFLRHLDKISSQACEHANSLPQEY